MLELTDTEDECFEILNAHDWVVLKELHLGSAF